jgi:hypothetical protein
LAILAGNLFQKVLLFSHLAVQLRNLVLQ